MLTLGTVVCGFVLDLLLGDPVLPVPHTVVVMGRCITALEGFLRRIFPKTDAGERAAGIALAVCMSGGTLALSVLLLRLLACLHPVLSFVLSVFWCWQALAMRDLKVESSLVQTELESNDLTAARAAVGRIVGRDTDALTREGVTKAAVETVAENFSDGVIAPLCYLMLGGAPLGLWYKAVNTMDSMVGYRNDRYRCFGTGAAKLDDLAGFIPARLSALLLILAAALTGQNARGGRRIWRRDRRNHPSPNSAQGESAMAGILGVQLGGGASYFGVFHPKPTIGDALQPVTPQHIARANRLMYAGGFLGLVILSAIRLGVLFLLKKGGVL